MWRIKRDKVENGKHRQWKKVSLKCRGYIKCHYEQGDLTCCACEIQPTCWLCGWNVTLFITPIYCACDSCRADCHCTHDADDTYFFLCAMLKQPAHNEMVIFLAACRRAVSHLHICSGCRLWTEYKMWTTGNPDYKVQWGKGTTDLIPEQMGTATILQMSQLQFKHFKFQNITVLI